MASSSRPFQGAHANTNTYDFNNNNPPRPFANNNSSRSPSPSLSRSPVSYPPPVNRGHPSAHPDSAYSRLRAQKGGATNTQPDRSYATSSPAHAYRGRTTRTTTVTPGADNLGAAAAGGGIAGVAVGVANERGRGRAVDAMSGYQYESYRGQGQQEQGQPYAQYADEGHHQGNGYDQAHHPGNGYGGYDNAPGGPPMDDGYGYYAGGSQFSGPERGVPAGYPQQSPYQGGPGMYNEAYSRQVGDADPARINPNDILDDGDDGFLPNPQRRSLLGFGNSSHNSLPSGAAAAGAGVGAGAGAGALGASALAGSSSGVLNRGGEGSPTGLTQNGAEDKSEWLDQQKSGSKKMKWIVGIVIAILIIGGVVGGVLGGVVFKKDDDSDSSGSSSKDGPGDEIQDADEDKKVNGDLGKDSSEIKALMGNSDLHKVFPGVDYTPWGTQYPLCLTYPPSQNNVTRDMAILSQMTNVVRLYGTDCNQTEMVLHAIDRLELADMKVWMGVWIDTNTTTNNRQLDQMYDILHSVDDVSVFKGVIVGNEVLFRGHQSTETLNKLSNYIDDVKSELAELDFDLPVATSDLGDAWTKDLAEIADAVMSNIHPFFGGVPVDEAAGWTYTFWAGNNKILTTGTDKDNIIAEVGWPTGGGNNCAPSPKCPDDDSGAIAGVDELNIFMDDWICQALDNGTNYFWFEAFDEPWKVAYNEPGKEWEDKWGLMTPDRKLKPGVKIPDCGGKTAD